MKLITDNVLLTYATFSPSDHRWRNLPSAMRWNLYLSSRYLFGMRNISKVNNINLTYNSLNSWFTHFHHESQLNNKNIIYETHSEKNTAKALFFIEKKKNPKYFQRYLWFYSLPVKPEWILNLVYCFASVLSFVGRVKVGIRNGKKVPACLWNSAGTGRDRWNTPSGGGTPSRPDDAPLRMGVSSPRFPSIAPLQPGNLAEVAPYPLKHENLHWDERFPVLPAAQFTLQHELSMTTQDSAAILRCTPEQLPHLQVHPEVKVPLRSWLWMN